MRFLALSLTFLFLSLPLPSWAGNLACDLEAVIERLYASQRKVPAAKLRGNKWSFDSKFDIDLRGGKFDDALDLAFKKTGVPKEQFQVTQWGKNDLGKSIPVEYTVLEGPNKGATVNLDWPMQTSLGPAYPHVGYSQAGKRYSGAAKGHIILEDVPATRGGP